MTTTDIARPKILYVDTESKHLVHLKRQFDHVFDFVSASEGTEALERIEEDGPFLIIITEMKLPDMDGVKLLTQVKERHPDTIRMVLTHRPNIAESIKAINHGQVFRFLTKPCVPQVFREAITAALAQHRHVTAERELLEDTLRGCVQALSEIFATIHPEAFGRSRRLKKLINEIMLHLGADEVWYAEVATMLAPIGYVTLPLEVVKKIYYGQELATTEEEMLQGARELTRELLSNIPRLEKVIEALADQDTPYSPTLRPDDPRRGEDILWGARILKIARDFDTLQIRGLSGPDAVKVLKQRVGVYDPRLVKALVEMSRSSAEPAKIPSRMLTIEELKPGMIFQADVTTNSGGLIVPSGQSVTPVIMERLKNYKQRMGVQEPIQVRIDQNDRSPQV